MNSCKRRHGLNGREGDSRRQEKEVARSLIEKKSTIVELRRKRPGRGKNERAKELSVWGVRRVCALGGGGGGGGEGGGGSRGGGGGGGAEVRP